MIIARKTFNFGKIAYRNPTRKANAVEVTVELTQAGGETTFVIDRKTGEKTITGKTPVYMELSISGNIWNQTHTNLLCGGQCLDIISKYGHQLNNKQLFETIYNLWKEYHLNGCHAGTPEQEKAITEWKKEGNKYDYVSACEMLKQKGLYEVNYTGISVGKQYNNEPYKYGHGWLVREIPSDILLKIENLLLAEE